MKKVLITGGGSGGHLAPIWAVVPRLRDDVELVWVGVGNPEEREAKRMGIRFRKIKGGKLRRYFSMKNLVQSLNTSPHLFHVWTTALGSFDGDQQTDGYQV